MTKRLMMMCVLLCVCLPAMAQPIRISGRYPHLAMYNHGGECGVGAVVPWADRLWAITYSPHMPKGSDDKLYQIDNDLKLTIRPESIGGTPANRMIHRESNQLFIGPYAIDAKGDVRVIPYSTMLGRPTANARHLTDPANKIYCYTMEKGLYEIDVKTLAVNTIQKDSQSPGYKEVLPEWHGKGAYSAQGRLVVANNGTHIRDYASQNYGPAGCLAEWTGPGSDWHVLVNNQFTEVTGPGGIEGNASADDPLWSVGWDRRSLILKLLDGGQWHTYRLPIADFSYVASHGWYTEWPRIRKIGPDGQYLMNMHGGWFEFPGDFSRANPAAPRPIGSYLKITGDYARWNNQLVFGCDDTAQTGGNKYAGQSHSNLWFTTWDKLRECGQPFGYGGPWTHDDIAAGAASDPYLFAGYQNRQLHLSHASDHAVTFTLKLGDKSRQIKVPAKGYVRVAFDDGEAGDWATLTADSAAKDVNAVFCYGLSAGAVTDQAMFAALAPASDKSPRSVGLIRPRGGDTGTLHMAAWTVDESGKATEAGYYEIGADMKLKHADDADALKFVKDKAKISGPDFKVDAASVIVTDRKGARYRLPKGDAAFDAAGAFGWPRGIREVVTERSLLNAHGTIYLLPDRDSTDVRGIKPVCTHNRRITDFCSWRGMLVLAGCNQGAKADGHYFASDDGKVGLWFGDIDDLWKLGAPRGVGGPWKNTAVKANEPSDPYLMTGYNHKTIALSHDAGGPIAFTIEIDPLADGTWLTYQSLTVEPGKTLTHEFPAGFNARWVRVKADNACRATAMLAYD